ncbi:MAG TPA: DUF4173 domain-containing protein [Armatimonadota bacterium]|jgi:hypothetical protein
MEDERVGGEEMRSPPADAAMTFGAAIRTPLAPPTEAEKRRAQRALTVAVAALALGVLGDALLRVTPWGLNVLLWTAALLFGFATVCRGRKMPRGVWWFGGAAAFFAVALVWRDAAYLRAIDSVGLVAALALAAAAARHADVRRWGFIAYVGRAAFSAAAAMGGFIVMLALNVRWDAIPRTGLTRRAGAVLRGILIAVPILLVFGALLVSADAAFERAIRSIFDWDIESLLSHLGLTAAFAWLAAGYLYQGVEERVPAADREELAPLPAPAPIEAGTVLALLDAMLLAFVATQIPHFAGLDASRGAAFREFARRGYFQLLVVSALALPVLTVAYRYAVGSRAGWRCYRALSSVLVGSILVVLASSAMRLQIMIAGTGLTELRLHSMAFLIWLAFVMAWFGGTVWRARPGRFALGALIAGFVAIVGLNAANPDAWMVRNNARGANVRVRFDAPYMANLSADAAPALIEALPYLTPKQRQRVEESLRHSASEPYTADWRTWNWGRNRARTILAQWDGRPPATAEAKQ